MNIYCQILSRECARYGAKIVPEVITNQDADSGIKGGQHSLLRRLRGNKRLLHSPNQSQVHSAFFYSGRGMPTFGAENAKC